MLELKPIGIGSAFSIDLGNNSWYMVIDKTMYIFDMPYSNIPAMEYNPILHLTVLNCDKFVVFITHMHEDHVGGLVNFIFLLKYKFRKRDITVSVPIRLLGNISQYISLTSGVKPEDIAHIPQEYYYEDDNIKVENVLVDHDYYLKSFGYFVYRKNQPSWDLFYSGDSCYFMNNTYRSALKGYKEFMENPEDKKIYHDITLDVNSGVHCHVEWVLSDLAFNADLLSHIVPMHLDHKSNIDALKTMHFDVSPLQKFIEEK